MAVWDDKEGGFCEANNMVYIQGEEKTRIR